MGAAEGHGLCKHKHTKVNNLAHYAGGSTRVHTLISSHGTVNTSKVDNVIDLLKLQLHKHDKTMYLSFPHFEFNTILI